MPQISQKTKDKISEQILHYIFTISPESQFTSEIASNIARDEEFTKSLLQDLQKKKLVIEIKKNSKGIDYKKRQRWRLSNEVYEIYNKKQNQANLSNNNNLYIESNIE